MTTGGILVRLLACFALVLATWNPTGYCFVDWIGGSAPLPLKAVVTTALALCHILFARIAWLSLGGGGTVFFLALFAAGVFALAQLGVVDLRHASTRTWMALSVVSLLLVTGLAWSLFKRRITGQSNYLNPPP